MDNAGRKRPGCFRRGCLTTLGGIAFVMVAAWMVGLWSERLPDRFVLRIPVGGDIAERPTGASGLPFAVADRSLSMQELLVILDRARTDRRIDTVLFDIQGLKTQPARIQQLRSAIENLRRSGRKSVAFLTEPEDGDYLMAVACDSVVVRKGGWLLLDGLKAELFFFAEPLEKIGIRFQAAQWKRYKSGVEPFTRIAASPEYLEQAGRILDGYWNDYLAYVAKRRGIDRGRFASVIDSLAALSPGKALALGLVDRVETPLQMEKRFEKRLGKDADELFVSGEEYLRATGGLERSVAGGSVAVVTIEGPIGSGIMADGDGTGEATLKRALRAALDDRDVKAIVLRIDSPGGEALAGESMLELVEDAARRKPVVASMSGVAASAGYMVAVGARSIVAEPLTLTGSIGVYALKPDAGGLLQKVGLHRQVVTRGRLADAATPFKPLGQEAFGKFVDQAGEIYDDFIASVARHRRMSPARVDAVAGGRVWLGQEALSVGLVDSIGGLDEAVSEAWKLAGGDAGKRPALKFLPARRTLLDYLLDGDASQLSIMVASGMAGRWTGWLDPFHGVIPARSASRLLLRTDAPQVLAIEPVDMVFR